jgi:cytochrome b561
MPPEARADPIPSVRTTYSPLQATAHWLTALLIASQWYTSGGVLRTHQMHPIYWKPDPYDILLHRLHIYGGVAILGLVMLRLFLRWRIGVPQPPSSLPRWSVILARPAHIAMYVVLAALSVTGLVTTYIWFGMNPVHRLLVNILYLLVSLHVAAALWHDLAHRVGLNERMLITAFRRESSRSVPRLK